MMTSDGERDFVDSIKYVTKKVVVYNLQVEGTHSYYAGGLAVHNRVAVKQPLSM